MSKNEFEIENMNDLRKFLASQLKSISDGKMTAAAANACSNVAGKILQASKLEIDYARIRGIKPDVKFLSRTAPDKILLESSVNEETGEVLN